jgi:predicted metalloprotease with PDZ domain
VTYKIYGDRVDGTYLAIDETHAHINMPAAIMWARGLDERPATLTFVPPPGSAWHVATQLHAGATPFEFTAPNLQYLMDSPTEVGPVAIRQFTVGPRTFRFAAHHTGTDAELASLVKAVEQIVGQEGAIYGEFPEYEPGYYTFIADYLPYASGDGMEHRNSTILTSASSIAVDRADLLDAVAHEFFHSWNVERIRPRSLEPFDLERANLSGELWLAEGFTQYYGPLALERAGLVDVTAAAHTFGDLVDTVTVGAGRLERTAEQMSQMAPFVDGARPIDRTNWSRTFVSYYPYGGAIALALDLSLRGRTDGQLSLDDFMRAMWRKYGKPGGTREGYVDHPYTIADAEDTLAEVSGDRAFAHGFFARYIQGHDVPDFAHLLERAGLALRKRTAGRAWLGDLTFANGRSKVATLVANTWPAYATGLEQDDELERVDNQEVRSGGDVAVVLGRHKPGDRIEIVFADRTGHSRTASVALAEDPHVEVVPVESMGIALTAAERSFRDRWLGPKQ